MFWQIILYLIYILLKNPVVKFKFQTLFVFVIIALLYLLYSLFFYDLSTELKIVSLRQFMMYFYFIVAYLYYNIYIKDSDLSELIRFLYRIGFISIILQVVYLLHHHQTKFHIFHLPLLEKRKLFDWM